MTSLQDFNTFNIDAKATQFSELTSAKMLKEVLKKSKLPVFILGGGSNILLTHDLHAHVLYNQIKGIKLIEENDKEVLVKVGAGENWHEFVLWTINQGYAGVENLSLIPGSVGAAPIQNIGAYGVELKDVFHQLSGIQLHSLKRVVMDNSDCEFDYRNSVFKQSLKGQLFITDVTLRLSKKAKLKLDYGIIRQELEHRNIKNPNIKDVSDTIISIRQSKLPDPKDVGNAGSFFKNPVIEKTRYDDLTKQFKKMPAYKVSKGLVKIPAAWLIDQCGWKGKRVGNTGCYKNQPLVIVNHGGATGKEILNHALNVKKSVYKTFGIAIENEVNII